MEHVEEKQDMKNETLLTLADVAEVFNTDVSKVESWVIKKLLRAIDTPPYHDLRFRGDDIIKFVHQNEREWLPLINKDNII
jgi:hypothetical protein